MTQIPDEAIEAAAEALFRAYWSDEWSSTPPSTREVYRGRARALYPPIRAAVLADLRTDLSLFDLEVMQEELEPVTWDGDNPESRAARTLAEITGKWFEDYATEVDYGVWEGDTRTWELSAWKEHVSLLDAHGSEVRGATE